MLGTFFIVDRNAGALFSGSFHKRLYIFFLFIFLCFLFHIFLSILIGVLFGGVDVISRDFYEIHRPVFYFLVFSYAYLVFSKVNEVERLSATFVVIFIIVVALGLNQYFAIFDSISFLYTKEGNVESRRVSAPFVNPYDYAFIMSFFVVYFFLKILYSNIFYFLPFVLATFMFVLPQSRSVAATFLIGFFVVMPILVFLLEFNVSKFGVPRKIFLVSFLILVMFIIFLFMIPYLIENFGYLTGQFVKLVEGKGIGRSAGIRLDQFIFLLEKASDNVFILLFGNGPSKNEMEYVESIYNYQLYRYGVLGFFLYFVFLVIGGCFFSWTILKNMSRNNPSYPLFLSLLVWFSIVPLMSVGNNFTEQIRLSFFFYSMLGMLASNYALTIQKRYRWGRR